MKSTTCLAIAVLFALSIKAQSQSIYTDTVYYKYELEQTSEFTESGDTVYEVFIIIDDEDLPKLNSLLVLNKDTEKNISLSEEAIKEDTRFEKKPNSLKIKVDKWPDLSDMLVTGLNDNSEQVILLDEEKKTKKKIKEIDTILLPVKRTRPPRVESKNVSTS